MTHSPDLADVMARVLGEAPAEVVTTVPDLWATVADLGWDSVAIEEDLGGQGGDLADVLETARGAGRFAPHLPIVENAVARHALAWTGLTWPFPGRPGVLVVPGASGINAPFAETAGRRWVVPGTVVVVLSSVPGAEHRGDGRCVVRFLVVDEERPDRAGVAMSGEPFGAVGRWDETLATDAREWRGDLAEITRRAGELGRLLRAGAIHGAAERACSATVDQVRTRVQFGRPLSSLASVRESVAIMSAQRGLVGAALSRALAQETSSSVAGAAALTVAARSGTEVARLAHQLHGAIGVTQENTLHTWTRRIWDWRDCDAGQRAACEAVGRQVVAGEESMWQYLTGVTS